MMRRHTTPLRGGWLIVLLVLVVALLAYFLY